MPKKKVREKVRKTYTGTDGREYRGKAIKARKRLELRIKAHDDSITRLKRSGIRTDGYHCPGSMSK